MKIRRGVSPWTIVFGLVLAAIVTGGMWWMYGRAESGTRPITENAIVAPRPNR